MIRRMDHVLVVDDDVELCALVQEYLTAEGFSLKAVHDGEQGLQQALTSEFALVVLDVMLPGINGFEVLRRIRSVSKIPVLLLTARGEDVDRIVGLEIGADDYLPKPFNPRELVARIRAILRRTRSPEAGRETQIPEMLREAGRVVTREDLASSVLSRKFSPFDRSIDMHVSKVRKKLGDSDGGSGHIKTVRGVGYIFAHPREQATVRAGKG